MFLKSLAFIKEDIVSQRNYPFSIPAFISLESLTFSSNVTIFIGENGSGKSTLLEAIAYRCDFNTAGGGRNNTYEVEYSGAVLGEHIRLSWAPKVTNGFFLRAESFFNFATHIDDLKDDPKVYRSYGGKSLHQQSHGESFLSLLTNRFRGKGIYLLDEPEAALSPARQLAFLKIINELEGEAQFIIATHSPIIMAYPGAQILDFDSSPIDEIQYEDTTQYQLINGFLNNRKLYLHKLFNESGSIT